jgi:hypothetical protein
MSFLFSHARATTPTSSFTLGRAVDSFEYPAANVRTAQNLPLPPSAASSTIFGPAHIPPLARVVVCIAILLTHDPEVQTDDEDEDEDDEDILRAASSKHRRAVRVHDVNARIG